MRQTLKTFQFLNVLQIKCQTHIVHECLIATAACLRLSFFRPGLDWILKWQPRPLSGVNKKSPPSWTNSFIMPKSCSVVDCKSHNKIIQSYDLFCFYQQTKKDNNRKHLRLQRTEIVMNGRGQSIHSMNTRNGKCVSDQWNCIELASKHQCIKINIQEKFCWTGSVFRFFQPGLGKHLTTATRPPADWKDIDCL